MHVVSVSESFLRAAERCMDGRSELGGEDHTQLLVPAVVCLAFSAEVGLKVLLQLQRTPIHDHKLALLYTALVAQTQQMIVANAGFAQNEFESRLQNASSTFVDWRYIYEEKNAGLSASVDFLARLAHATQKTIAALKPREA